MAAIDEIVFHQILAWHHFYDNATSDIALLSDGLLHAAELFIFVFGFFLMLDARRRGTFWPAAGWAGFLVGLGLFQLWDGVIDHKVLRLHQIRYGVELLPYDIAWNVAGGLLLVAGVVWTMVLARRGNPAAKRSPSDAGVSGPDAKSHASSAGSATDSGRPRRGRMAR